MTDDTQANRGHENDDVFNFAAHRRTAVEDYLRVRPKYEDFAAAVLGQK